MSIKYCLFDLISTVLVYRGKIIIIKVGFINMATVSVTTSVPCFTWLRLSNTQREAGHVCTLLHSLKNQKIQLLVSDG